MVNKCATEVYDRRLWSPCACGHALKTETGFWLPGVPFISRSLYFSYSPQVVIYMYSSFSPFLISVHNIYRWWMNRCPSGCFKILVLWHELPFNFFFSPLYSHGEGNDTVRVFFLSVWSTLPDCDVRWNSWWKTSSRVNTPLTGPSVDSLALLCVCVCVSMCVCVCVSQMDSSSCEGKCLITPLCTMVRFIPFY